MLNRKKIEIFKNYFQIFISITSTYNNLRLPCFNYQSFNEIKIYCGSILSKCHFFGRNKWQNAVNDAAYARRSVFFIELPRKRVIFSCIYNCVFPENDNPDVVPSTPRMHFLSRFACFDANNRVGYIYVCIILMLTYFSFYTLRGSIIFFSAIFF